MNVVLHVCQGYVQDVCLSWIFKLGAGKSPSLENVSLTLDCFGLSHAESRSLSYTVFGSRLLFPMSMNDTGLTQNEVRVASFN